MNNDIEDMDRIGELICDELEVDKSYITNDSRKSFHAGEVRAVICLIASYYYHIEADTIADFCGFKTTCTRAPRTRQVNARISKFFVEADKNPEKMERLNKILDYLGLDDSGIMKAYEDRAKEYRVKKSKKADIIHTLLYNWSRVNA